MFHRTLRFLARFAVACLVLLASSGVGHLWFNSGSDASASAAADAVRALAVGTPLENTVPQGFTDVMGYQPNAGGKPNGICSTPDGNGYDGFVSACRIHDYGYDLLRYAARTDEPLGPWARLAIDRRFHRDMVAACESTDCLALAHVYGFGVGMNSVRQGFTAPTKEPTAPWLMLGGLTLGAAALPLPQRTGTRHTTISPAPATPAGIATLRTTPVRYRP